MEGKERKYDTKLCSIFLNFNKMYTRVQQLCFLASKNKGHGKNDAKQAKLRNWRLENQIFTARRGLLTRIPRFLLSGISRHDRPGSCKWDTKVAAKR